MVIKEALDRPRRTRAGNRPPTRTAHRKHVLSTQACFERAILVHGSQFKLVRCLRRKLVITASSRTIENPPVRNDDIGEADSFTLCYFQKKALPFRFHLFGALFYLCADLVQHGLDRWQFSRPRKTRCYKTSPQTSNGRQC